MCVGQLLMHLIWTHSCLSLSLSWYKLDKRNKMYNQSWLFFARWKYPYTHTRGTQHTLINVHAHFWLNGIFICCHEKWCVWMRRNKLWSILVKWNLYPGSLISGTTAIVFVFLLVLAMLLRLLFVFFSFLQTFCMRGAISSAFKTAKRSHLLLPFYRFYW